MDSKRKRLASLTRRKVLMAAPAILVFPSSLVGAAEQTPKQMAGPFYPRKLPEDQDADLTEFLGRQTKGEVIEMAGHVKDLAGQAISGAVVEIWHCDPAGIYPHVGRNNGGRADPDFQGFGMVRTGSDGAYRFRTIRPGVYPGRVRHIHVKVRREGSRTFTTQMYFPEEDNDDDFLFANGGTALLADRIDGPPVRYVWDIFLA